MARQLRRKAGGANKQSRAFAGVSVKCAPGESRGGGRHSGTRAEAPPMGGTLGGDVSRSRASGSLFDYFEATARAFLPHVSAPPASPA